MNKTLMAAMIAGLAMVTTAASAADTLAKPGSVFKDCPTCPELVVIPPGSFTQGRDRNDVAEPVRYEGPPHAVKIGYSFAAGKTEVTTAQYGDFIRESGYQPSPGCRLWNDRWLNDAKSDWRGDGLRKAACIDKKRIALHLGHAPRHGHGFSRCRGFVEQRSVADFHASQINHHLLKVDQRV